MKPETRSDPDNYPVADKQELVDAAKNWLAMDGLWFQAVESAYGIEAAIAADLKVWEQFSAIEARRIMERLGLPEQGGLDALEVALKHRLYFHINRQEITWTGPATLLLSMKTCRVQAARERKHLPPFPCRPVGIVEYRIFAQTIDTRIGTECLTCPPERRPDAPYCSWKFSLHSESPAE